MEQFREFPLRSRVYVIVWWILGLIAGAAVLASAVLAAPALRHLFVGVEEFPAPPSFMLILLLAAAFCVGSRKVILTRSRAGSGPGGSMSVAFVTTYLTLLFFGIAEAVLAAIMAEMGRGAVSTKRYRWYQLLFNIAAVCLATVVAGWVYLIGGGRFGVPLANAAGGVDAALSTVDLATWQGLFGSMLAFYLINTIAVAGILALTRGERIAAVWRSSFLWTAPGYFAAASFAGWTRAAYVGLGPAGFLMALPIPILIHFSYRTYLEKVEQHEQHIDRLKQEQRRLDEVYHSALECLALAIDAKDKYTRQHISRVQAYAVAIARRVGVSPDQLQAIRTAAMLHDIGKLAVPEQILVKPGKLTQEEVKRMQTHVRTGAMILEPVEFPWPVIPIVETHHERWDGSGYPAGLKGEEIPLGGRIVALADFFDAVTSDRPYHRARSREEAMSLVIAGRGTLFDPAIVDAFFDIFESIEEEIAAINRTHETPGAKQSPQGEGQKERVRRALDEVSRASDELYALYETVQPLGRSLDTRETLDVIVEKTRSLVPFDTCAIFWRTQRGDELRAEVVAGLHDERLQGMTIKVGEGLSGWVAAHGRGIVNKPASMDVARKLSPQDEIELDASLVAPLVLDGCTVGTISLYSRQIHLYTEEHLRLLTIIADHAVTAIDNARRFEHTRELAMTDALTGLPNARALAARLAREIEHSQREGTPLAIVLIDLDNFKLVNDRLGHVAGDRALRDVGRILSREAGDGGFVSRYAGDEFVAVLPGAGRGIAERLASRFRLSLSEHLLRDPEGGSVVLGASAGVALCPDDGCEPRLLIHCADRRMYQDKFESREFAFSARQVELSAQR
jgi:diguanylate cyclase (GGDEF)-like protein/putative nucleotidyltransferase with HDIG domain